jgi:NADPH2:quinone reductase
MVVREFGPPSVMRLEEVADPKPGPGEVLIRVQAVSVNRTLDTVVRAGKFERQVTLPVVLGVDPAGVIVELGQGVSGRRLGDRVITSTRAMSEEQADGPRLRAVHAWGGYAEYFKAPVEGTIVVPEQVDLAMASVIARHAPTAFHLLRDWAKLKSGEWVLVMGAAGGLGSAGVQVGKLLGARVIAAAGAPDRVKAGMDLGADAGVNYRTGDLSAEVMRITQDRGVDVVFENIGDPVLFPKAFAALARGGRLVTAGGHGGGIVPLDVNRLYLKQITVIGAKGHRPEDLALSLEAAARGRFKALIACVLPLSQAALAHELVESRSTLGKVVLDPTLQTAVD